MEAGLHEIGLALDATQVAKLLAYLALLQKWNATYNLTAVRDPDEMLVQHLLDSLAVIPAVDARVPLAHARIADVGSGAGLPGIPWAIVFPAATVRLVEPVGKKSAFQRQCQAELGLANLIVTNGRAEDVRDPQDVVVCRAFASLADFVAASESMAPAGSVRVAMKGRVPEAELRALPAGLDVETIPVHVPQLNADRHLVLMRA